MTAPLRKIEAQLRKLAKGVEENTPATRAQADELIHELRIIATQIGLQAEQIELGLTGRDM